ncbi:MAG: hypothetical protein ACKO3R_08175 [bacterium]
MAAGREREVAPEQGDMQEMVNKLQGKAGELVDSLRQNPISNNGGRIVKTLAEGETDTIATT